MTQINLQSYPCEIETGKSVGIKIKHQNFLNIYNEISWENKTRITEIISSNKLNINRLEIWWKPFMKIQFYNREWIFNINWEKVITNYDYWENDYKEYLSRFYNIEWKYYYTWPKRSDNKNFTQIYDLRNCKWEENALHIIFNESLDKIIYKWEEWDIISKKEWNKVTIISNNWEEKQVNFKTWKILK